MSAWAAGPPKQSPFEGDVPLGTVVKLTTILGDEVSGEVFAVDKAAELVMLKSADSKPGESVMRLLNTRHIKEVLERTPPPADFAPEKLPVVNEERAARREQDAVAAAEEAAQRIGVGVTREAQTLFDALAKTLPCRWSDKKIVVLEEVTISEPYKPENCVGGDAMLNSRVQKVLEKERQRIDGTLVI